jgi:hypothetical protein
LADPGNRGGPGEIPSAGREIHRRFYFTSVLRTLGFYGTVLALGIVLPYLVALGILFFFVRFYREELGYFFRHPVRALLSRTPPEFSSYSFEVFSPGSFGNTGERDLLAPRGSGDERTRDSGGGEPVR